MTIVMALLSVLAIAGAGALVVTALVRLVREIFGGDPTLDPSDVDLHTEVAPATPYGVEGSAGDSVEDPGLI